MLLSSISYGRLSREWDPSFGRGMGGNTRAREEDRRKGSRLSASTDLLALAAVTLTTGVAWKVDAIQEAIVAVYLRGTEIFPLQKRRGSFYEEGGWMTGRVSGHRSRVARRHSKEG